MLNRACYPKPDASPDSGLKVIKAANRSRNERVRAARLKAAK